MSNRAWYYAAQGQQQGPVSEGELHDLVASGVVAAATLVWSDGMAGWEKAGDVPGLMSDVADRSAGSPPTLAEAAMPGGIAPLSVKLELWPYLGWTLLFVLGELVVIPTPWTATALYRYVIDRIRVPGRPNLAFTGQPLDIWYVFIAMGVLTYVGMSDKPLIQLLATLSQSFLSWMVLRWVISKLASDGRPLPLSFEGSPLVYFGWYVLLLVSAITIVGWAWVVTGWMRWICRNIAGTRREVVFNASGMQMLWRTLVFAFGCAFIIPIPWLLRWYTEWYVSQFALVGRTQLSA